MTDPIVRHKRSSTPAAVPTLSEGQLGVNLNDKKIFIGPSGGGTGVEPNYVNKQGDTMTGLLVLSGDPGAALGAATKQYVDAQEPFASGTEMVFFQAAAPTGWTQNTTHNDKMMRVVSTAGGGNGGSDSPILMDKVPTHNHTASTGTDGAHTHQIQGTGEVSFTTLFASGQNAGNVRNVPSTGSAHSHSVTVNNNAGGSNWTPKYVDMIICSKD